MPGHHSLNEPHVDAHVNTDHYPDHHQHRADTGAINTADSSTNRSDHGANLAADERAFYRTDRDPDHVPDGHHYTHNHWDVDDIVNRDHHGNDDHDGNLHADHHYHGRAINTA